jgi:apolipoprotein D and lipocalin family protein
MNLHKLALAALLALPLALPAHAEVRDSAVPMVVVDSVDIDRYLGQWYEIARFPNRFEAGCTNVTATYALRKDGNISVANACTKDGTTEVTEGKAWVEAPGKLKVTFVPWLGSIAAGDYWVMDLKPDYSMAVVGAPTGGFGWILARGPKLSKADKDRALKVLASNGYDTNQLEWVQH